MKLFWFILKWLAGLFKSSPIVNNLQIVHKKITPQEPANPLMAKDVIDDYISFTCAGQIMILRKNEKKYFDSFPRPERRRMAKNFGKAVKSGRIKLMEINGKIIALKNKDYGNDRRTNKKDTPTKQSGFNKVRPGPRGTQVKIG